MLTAIITALFAISSISAQESLSVPEAQSIAIDAYIYGYPLITLDTAKRVMTNVETPTNMRAPMGQFGNMRSYPDASMKDITGPNADTLYSMAWLDLSNEPYILHVPDEKGRYYLIPIMSAWTNVIAAPGTRTTGTNPHDFAITGPGWKGQLPKGVEEIKSPTNMVWIIGRTYCSGTAKDFEMVQDIQDQYSLVPLSSYGKSYAPPKGVVDPTIDMKSAVRTQVNSMDIESYFKKLASLMNDNPPPTEDAPILVQMAKIGLVPGKDFDINNLSSEIQEALKSTPATAQQAIKDQMKDGQKDFNGWKELIVTGFYGTNYIQRALVATIGLGACLPKDAIYALTRLDNKNQPLSGSHKYVIHFDKGQTPPVKGFWSLTLYDDQYFFFPNPLNRYTLSERNAFKYNPDGSLDLYIQNSSPAIDKVDNWLPAPEGAFILMLRLYWPKEAVLNDLWMPPVVQQIE